MEYITDYKADFVFISETWLVDGSNVVSAYFKSMGYNFYAKNRELRRGGGVAILCKNKYNLQEIAYESYISFEYCCFSFLHYSGKKLILISLYRPPLSNINQFFNEFTKLLEFLITKNSYLIICGDINIHLDLTSNTTSSFLEILSTFNLSQNVNVPTHSHGHTLDTIITTLDLQLFNITSNDVKLSDHFLINCYLNLDQHPLQYKEIITRNYKLFSKESFQKDLRDNLELINFESQTFHCVIKKYENLCKELIEQHAPTKCKLIKVQPDAPWFDSEYATLRRKRRKAEKKYKKSKLLVDKQIFINLRKECVVMAREKKINFFRSKIESSKNNVKTLYSVVNNLLDRNVKHSFPENADSLDLANDFSNFFSNKVKKIRNTIPYKEENASLSNNINFDEHFNNLSKLSHFEPVTIDEIKTIITNSGISTSINDHIPKQFLTSELDIFLPTWCAIINKSLISGDISGLKESIILPLLKNSKLNTEDLKNYRPVSNLPFLEKLIERVVLKRLNHHLNINNLLIPNQYGYKKAHSTETLLVKVVNDILVAADKGSSTILLLLDLSAAFDTVDQRKLINILKNDIGIDGTALRWFKSFLIGRKQKVKVNNSMSETIDLEFGVPQGSVLGPVLFNIYIRSFYSKIHSTKFEIEGFADDHQIYTSFIPSFQRSVLVDKINKCFETVKLWMNEYFLKLNSDKTKIILFTPSTFLQNNISIKGTFINNGFTCIRFSNNAINLGILLDKYLNFSAHVLKITKQCFMTISNLSKIRSFLDMEQLKIMVCSLVLSKLDYCNGLYTCLSKELIGRLQSVQNSAAKLIYKRRKFDHVSDLFYKLHWLNIEQRIAFKVIILVHQSLYLETFVLPLKKSLKLLNQRTLTFAIPITKTKFGKYAFSYIGPKMWNCLPLELKQLDDLDLFKKRLKHYLFNEYNIFIQRLNIS